MNIEEFVEKQKWIFAKTYANKAPHEYIVRGKAEGTDEEFLQMIDYIQKKGFVMHFWGHPNRYIYQNGHFYWVMRDSDDDPTAIINRCVADDYYVSTRWKGRDEAEQTR